VSLHDDTESQGEPEPSTFWRWLVVLGLAGLALAAHFLVATDDRQPADVDRPPAMAPRPAAPPPGTAVRPAPQPKGPGAAPSRAPRTAAPASPSPAATTPVIGPRLKVTSDVSGAFVFLDRKYLGTTPLDTTEVASGSHQLKVTAQGYDGVDRSVKIAGETATEIAVSLKTVRLDASVDVVHKHAVGSCEGRLVATPQGLRYETTRAEDAFSVPLDRLETFDLDYLKKNLRVKPRSGRTWNFTTRSENADPLLVFARQVDAARTKLRESP
jgi:hypothetical protein